LKKGRESKKKTNGRKSKANQSTKKRRRGNEPCSQRKGDKKKTYAKTDHPTPEPTTAKSLTLLEGEKGIEKGPRYFIWAKKKRDIEVKRGTELAAFK